MYEQSSPKLERAHHKMPTLNLFFTLIDSLEKE
jgi:hypothetical protein